MAYDEGLAQLMRDDLAHLDGVTEKKMFGGIAFMTGGNMICGVHKDGAMFRVGKDREAEAHSLDGVGKMLFTGRPMGGMVDAAPEAMVDAAPEAMADDSTRGHLMALALAHAKSLPPK